MADLPKHARVVVIGGGAIGASVLYHLAERGWSDLVLLEKNELTAGSTWHAAGNCPNFVGNWTALRLQNYSTKLYAELGERVGYPMNYNQTGSIRLARTKDRFEEFKHISGLAKYYGVHFDLAGPDALKDYYPLAEAHGLEGVLWDATDGDIDPAQLTQAFAKGARDLGAKIIRFCPVTGLTQTADGGWTVATARGDIQADMIVNAAGYYAPEIGRMIGRDVPSVVLEHQYLISEPIPEINDAPGKLPLLRDPDDSYYLREERGGLMLGPYEHQNARARWVNDDAPDDFSFGLFDDDLERLEWYIEQACARVPLLGTAGVQKVINGPVPYSPDGFPFIGPTPGVRNAFEACVYSFGIIQAGGTGKAMADWMIEGEPEWDLWSLDPRRYTGYTTKSFCIAKALEVYENEYGIPYPAEERRAGYPQWTNPVTQRLAAKGAMFGARGGWERATWFPRDGDVAEEKLSFHRTNWFDATAEECRAMRDTCGVIDMTGFSRLEVSGPDAEAALDYVFASKLPKLGRTGLAYALTPKGKIWSEFTVTRIAEDRFWLISAAAALWHDQNHLTFEWGDRFDVTLKDITRDFGTLALAGPKARDILSAALNNSDSVAKENFRWLAYRELDFNGAPLHAIRVGFVGELGWELHAPIAQMGNLYDTLHEVGAAHGLRDVGMYAMDSLRIEKSYRAWKTELSNEFSPLEAGLERFIDFDKAEFVGRAAVLAERDAGSNLKLVTLKVDVDTADPAYGAMIYSGNDIVGFTTSAAHGHRVGHAIAIGYINREDAGVGRAFEVDIVGTRRPIEIIDDSPYDPENARLRA
ncbi:MAG: FAD-dependent oxidoreductase [Pseudomonadota bacterium]